MGNQRPRDAGEGGAGPILLQSESFSVPPPDGSAGYNAAASAESEATDFSRPVSTNGADLKRLIFHDFS